MCLICMDYVWRSIIISLGIILMMNYDIENSPIDIKVKNKYFEKHQSLFSFS